MIYPVTKIFGPTLQGEGYWSGYPAMFIRLAGCSVRNCFIRKECDEAPWKATEYLSESNIAQRVQEYSRIVITGGEPTDHDLEPLIRALSTSALHLETSGKRAVPKGFTWVTVSPKSPNYIQRYGDELKLVVRPGWGWAEIESLAEGNFTHRFLQPMTDPNTGKAMNLAEVIDLLVSTDGNWALSTQAHKIWGMP